MRGALLYGGIASFVLVAAPLLATPSSSSTKGYNLAASFAGGIPTILAALPQWAQDLFLLEAVAAKNTAKK